MRQQLACIKRKQKLQFAHEEQFLQVQCEQFCWLIALIEQIQAAHPA